ncbi:unnamed protein product [Urochloa humidicola]
MELHSNTEIGDSHPHPKQPACLDWPLTARHSSSSSLRPALERDRPDDHLVVDGSQSSADEGTDPEDPLQRQE